MKKSRGTEKEIELNNNANACFDTVDRNKSKSV